MNYQPQDCQRQQKPAAFVHNGILRETFNKWIRYLETH